MKFIPVACVLIFMVKLIIAKSDEDSLETHDLQSGEDNANTSLIVINNQSVPNKAKKFVVSLKKPSKTSFQLSKRGGQKKNLFPKFQIQHNVPRESTYHVSTKRPHLMQAKKFTSKPHTIDHVEKLIERSNFHKKRNQNKFDSLGAGGKNEMAEKNDYKTKHLEHFKNHFQNFTDIDISNENDSDESNETEKPLRRRYMKTAASDKVKAVVPPPLTNPNTQRNYKIKDLLKTHRYIPKVDRKMVPVLALQRGNSVVIADQNDKIGLNQISLEKSPLKMGDLSPEEDTDQSEFIFVKNDKLSSTTASPEDDVMVTSDPIFTS